MQSPGVLFVLFAGALHLHGQADLSQFHLPHKVLVGVHAIIGCHSKWRQGWSFAACLANSILVQSIATMTLSACLVFAGLNNVTEVVM